jgi:hypothetical protein
MHSEHLLRRALWDQGAVRDEHQARVKRALGERGILILDETGFLKEGRQIRGGGPPVQRDGGKN